MSKLNTHGVTLTFGKHKGTLLTRVPVGYLRFMVNEGTPQTDLARAEIDRRGHKLPEVELSGHAIDNASLRVWNIWQETSNNGEGFHSWLSRMTLSAIAHGDRDGDCYFYKGMKLAVQQGEEFPCLKTVMRDKRKDAGQ